MSGTVRNIALAGSATGLITLLVPFPGLNLLSLPLVGLALLVSGRWGLIPFLSELFWSGIMGNGSPLILSLSVNSKLLELVPSLEMKLVTIVIWSVIAFLFLAGFPLGLGHFLRRWVRKRAGYRVWF